VVIRTGQAEGVPGVVDGARDVAACLCQRGAVDGDRRRCVAQVVGVRPGGGEVPVAGAGGQGVLGVAEAGVCRVEVAGHHQ
jgi:hypothetical protein